MALLGLLPSLFTLYLLSFQLPSLVLVEKLWKTSPTFHRPDHPEQIEAIPLHFRRPCQVWLLVLQPTKLKTRFQDPKQLPSHPPWSHQGLTPGLLVVNHPLSREVSVRRERCL